jgi:hypothetical protein
MIVLKGKLYKAKKLIAAEGFIVFFRKAVRRLYWEFGSKYLARTHSEDTNYKTSMNQLTRCLLIKQTPAIDVINKDPEAVAGLLEVLKDQIIEVRQEKKP